MSLDPRSSTDYASPSIPAPKKSHTGFLILVFLAVAAIGGGVAYQLSLQKAQQQELAANFTERAAAGPAGVNVATIHSAPSDGVVELSGQTVALVETPIYARADGYLKERPVDIGQHVKKGDLLIQLDTPDLDQQIEQARATLAQSKAALAQLQANVLVNQSNLRLAQVTADRTKALTEQGVFSKQEFDNRQAAVAAGDASVRAAQENARAQEAVIAASEASLKRLLEQKNYARMVAPYDGVVTYRNPLASDIGTLITSGSSTGAREILRVSQIQKLRVFVDVPQSLAPLVHLNQPVNLTVDEFPGRVFTAKVSSTTGAVDPASRTMLTVLVLDNAAGTLMPGMYVKSQFRLARKVNVLRLPAEALITNGDGTSAAIVGADDKVHMQKITVGRDYGTEIEVTAGLTEGDRVVLNPSDALRDGMTVQPKERAKSGKQGG